MKTTTDQLTFTRLHKLCSKTGLTLPNLVFLETLSPTEARPPERVCRALDLTVASVSSQKEKLEAMGLLTEEAAVGYRLDGGTDRRRRLLRRTAKGTRAIEDATSSLNE